MTDPRLADLLSAIEPLDATAMSDARERQAQLTKPAGALGVLEEASVRLSGIQRVCPPAAMTRPVVAVFAGDHGVHAQGVTPWPQEVTASMIANFRAGGAAVNVLARQAGADVYVVDMGVAADLVARTRPARPQDPPRYVGPGDRPRDEQGRGRGRACWPAPRSRGGWSTRATTACSSGDMGIANTTPSAALVAAFTGSAPGRVTGRGTGVDDPTLARKVEVISSALLERPPGDDPVETLASLGGFEHAGIAGFVLGRGGAPHPGHPRRRDRRCRRPRRAGARARTALDYCFAGHRSVEPGHVVALERLGLRPLVDLDLRLGEGTGAVLSFPLVEAAGAVLREMATFDSAGVARKDADA